MSDVLNRRDTSHKVITAFEDLPNFDLVSDDEVTAWCELNEVSAEILKTLEDTGAEIDFDFVPDH